MIPRAEALIRAKPDIYIPFAPDVRLNPSDKGFHWTRFKCVDLCLFFLLVPAREVCIDIEKKASIVRGKTGLPFPSLPTFVQSLLDSHNLLDLEDIIDAMDLSEEWAAENGVNLPDGSYPGPHSLKAQWERIARTKQKRMGLKYNPRIYASRYRRHRERDPRETGWL